MKNIIAIIPARSGSKRLVGKNMIDLNHIPLVEHTFRFCQQVNKFNQVIVSTDDENILQLAEKYNFTKHHRDKLLCTDTSLIIDTLQNIMLEFSIKDSIVVLLQPTSPFRTNNTVCNMIDLFKVRNDTVITVQKADKPRYGRIHNKKYIPENYIIGTRSQDMDAYWENGNIYVFDSETIINKQLCREGYVPYIIEGNECVDIDTINDLRLARNIAVDNSKTNKHSVISLTNNKIIGEDCPCFIIAEACVNHMGSMKLAKDLIDMAVRCKADAVKFQYHIPDEEMLKNVPASKNFGEPLYDILSKYSLTIEQHKELKEYCDSEGIMYMCTPFCLRAARELNDLVQVFKIGSGELTDIPTLLEIAKLGKPMIISTGMSTLDEIESTLNILLPINKNIVLLNCTSEYPPVYEDINLGVISIMKDRFGVIIGHSDHTPDTYTSYGAVVHGAKIIEKHITLDKAMPTPDKDVSINEVELMSLIDGIRKLERASGTRKIVHKKEKEIQNWARRSIVTIKDINKGDILSLDNIWCKRPGNGIKSSKLFDILGRVAIKDLKRDRLLVESDYENFDSFRK